MDIKQIFQLTFGNGEADLVECHCGRRFFHNSRVVFKNQQLKKLRGDSNATGIERKVSLLAFEGKQYTAECDCWHEAAHRVSSFLVTHNRQVASFLNEFKRVAKAEAEALPEVDED